MATAVPELPSPPQEQPREVSSNSEPVAPLPRDSINTGRNSVGLNSVNTGVVSAATPSTLPQSLMVMQDSSSAASPNTAQFPGSEVVFGVPIEDDGMRKVIRRVIVLAAIGASFYIVHFIGNLMSGVYDDRSAKNSSSLWTAMSSLLIELSIPACGYYGALHGNRQLMCCFCSCNLFVTVVGVVSFIRLNVRIVELDGRCEREKSASHRRTCEVWTENTIEKYIMIASMILGTCLGTIAFWVGSSLYQRLAHEFMHFGQHGPPLVGEVISLAAANSGSPSAVASSQPATNSRPVQVIPSHGVVQQGPQTASAVIVVPATSVSTVPSSDSVRSRPQAANLRAVSPTQTSDVASTGAALQCNTASSVTVVSPSRTALPSAPTAATNEAEGASRQSESRATADDISIATGVATNSISDQPATNSNQQVDASVCVATVLSVA